MQRVTPYLDHAPGSTRLVAVRPDGGKSTLRFEARPNAWIHSLSVAADGSWAVEIEWPNVLADGLMLPPAHGTWRREDGKWVAHNPADAAQAALLVETVPDPPEVAQRRLEARIAALEAAIAKK